MNQPAVSGLGFDWGGLFENISEAGLDIAKGRYGTPTGMYTRYGADGKPLVTYRQPDGSTAPIFAATDIGASANVNAQGGGISMNTILIAGVAVFALFMMSRR